MSEVTLRRRSGHSPASARHLDQAVLRHVRMFGRALAFAVVLGAGPGCVAEEPLGPPPPNMTGPVTGGSTSLEGGSESETGSGAGPDACDPLADPLLECGPGQRCDLLTRTCVDASGIGVLDELCETTDDCNPGLVCREDRCRELCDPTLEAHAECSGEQVCTYADAPLPGLCRAPCSLLLDDCEVGTDACKRGLGPDAELLAVCIANPGAGVEGDPCTFDGECNPGFLCTPSELHTLPCFDEAPACCAPICDTLQLLCLGLEPVCYPLGIPGQASVGFCGAG